VSRAERPRRGADAGQGHRAHRPVAAYPGFDVMRQADHWDPATRALITRRVRDIPPIRFFTRAEAHLLTAAVDRILPQDDRCPDERIPIVPWIDARCFERITDGWRLEDLPPDEEAWRLGLRGIDQTARIRFGVSFVELSEAQQDEVLRLVASGQPPGSIWQQLPARRFWIFIVLQQVCAIYYAHPTAWNEIGFGGPAYPRGYFALNRGDPEPWETREVRLDATADSP
jgi:hypothetical protein